MNSQKKIEINQSSLLGLKAELLRKKNEVSSAKYSQEIKKVKVAKKKFVTKLEKSNEGVNERDQRDAEEIAQEVDEIKKSQSALEAKAKLYDKLTNNSGSISHIDTSNFLVDFKQKSSEEASVVNDNVNEKEKESEAVESDYGEYNDDDDEWVDFVDCLGRTKRCHRDDLDAMKEQDEKLKISLFGEMNKAEEKAEVSEGEMKLPELCSEDMRKEILRQKWEEQERNLLDKKNVHYQDVLFDEARTHGVGYYGFSTDEAERVRQQEELRKLRKETEELQAEAQTAAQRKQKQMEERLKAARRRKRERLGLPPEEEEEKTETEVPEVREDEKKAEPPEELRRDVRKPASIRPWDIGKDKTTKVLSQEEWVEKKRSERPEEFAPPTSISRVKHFPKKQKTGRFEKTHQSYEPNYSSMDPVPIDDELDVKDTRETRGRGVEIPPPPIFDLYGTASKGKKTFSTLSQSDIDKSIEEGLNFLRKQVEEKQKSGRRRDEIDIM